MPISFDAALGIHDKALAVRAARSEILASNMANADTPGFKARDIDFRSALSGIQNQTAASLGATHQQHFATDISDTSSALLYRVPNQPSLDGNTVDSQLEKAAFAENALRYQASLTFLEHKFKGLISALRGE